MWAVTMGAMEFILMIPIATAFLVFTFVLDGCRGWEGGLHWPASQEALLRFVVAALAAALIAAIAVAVGSGCDLSF